VTAVFSSSSDVNPALRRAALTLYATHSDDREWVLARLSERDHPSLKELLAELASLGIPRDPELVRFALSQGAAEIATRPLQKLGRIGDAARCAAVLESEPIALVACALAVVPDLIRAQILEQLSPNLQRKLQSEPAVQVPPRLREVLMHQLTEQFGQDARGGARASLRAAVSSLFRALRGRR